MSFTKIDSKVLNWGDNELLLTTYQTHLDPTSALKDFDDSEIFYFQNKDNSLEICAFGASKKNLTKNECEDLLKRQEKDLFILGARGFYSFEPTAQENELEWDNFNYSFYIPKFAFVRKGKETYLFAITKEDEYPKFSDRNINTNYKLEETSEITKKDQWIENVQYCQKQMREKGIDKAVLSRKIKKVYNNTIDHFHYFFSLRDEFMESYQIYYKINDKAYLSFTPETLYQIENDRLSIDCIAGTIKKEEDEEKSHTAREAFKKDPKELEEHRIVCQSIEDTLKEVSITPAYVFKEEILSLKHVEHLHSKIEINIENQSKVELLNSLHPTPAVGGRPRKQALELIKEIEQNKRGLYASPIGLFNSETSEFAVAIRSCLIRQNEMYLYGGCGIVKDSDPNKEWIETQTKMKNFL